MLLLSADRTVELAAGQIGSDPHHRLKNAKE